MIFELQACMDVDFKRPSVLLPEHSSLCQHPLSAVSKVYLLQRFPSMSAPQEYSVILVFFCFSLCFPTLPDDRHDVLCYHHASGADEFWGRQASHPVSQRGAIMEIGQEHLLHALLDDLWGSVCRPDRP